MLEALSDTRIVAIQGARQVGKTTLVRQVIDGLGGRLETLDDEDTRRSADEDPVGFLTREPDRLLAVDELQRVPKLILALKLIVDRDPRPGRFLVTGSADLVRMPTSEDTLAGRVENVDLYGFSQGELVGHVERFVDRALDGDRFLGHTSSLSRHAYLERATSGGYPEALQRAEGRRRDDWLDGYLARIVDRDAPEVSSLRRIRELPRILEAVAARNAAELNLADLARDTEIPVRTLGPYLELLEILYLVHRLPAWSRNLTKRAVARPKVAVVDTGLAARLIHTSARGAAGDLAGPLLEGFVAGELRRQLAWSETRARLAHFRDRSEGEVGLVLDAADGRVVGIEVKSAVSVGRRDARGLETLRDKLGARFVGGFVLHSGQRSRSLGERITAAPIDLLWSA